MLLTRKELLLHEKKEKLCITPIDETSTYILMGRYNHSLSLDVSILVSKNCPTIGEHVGTIFVTQ